MEEHIRQRDGEKRCFIFQLNQPASCLLGSLKRLSHLGLFFCSSLSGKVSLDYFSGLLSSNNPSFFIQTPNYSQQVMNLSFSRDNKGLIGRHPSSSPFYLLLVVPMCTCVYTGQFMTIQRKNKTASSSRNWEMSLLTWEPS